MKNSLMLSLVLIVVGTVTLEGQSSDSSPTYFLVLGQTFLGCLNCPERDSRSICNRRGAYGNPQSRTSIWNSFEFSSFEEKSPWSSYASNPPAILDSSGEFHGYLTANRFKRGRTNIRIFITLAERGINPTNRNQYCAAVRAWSG